MTDEKDILCQLKICEDTKAKLQKRLYETKTLNSEDIDAHFPKGKIKKSNIWRFICINLCAIEK